MSIAATKYWTVGAELELSDWPRQAELPHGCTIDMNDVTMVNSNGVAVDPRGVIYHLGGEIQTAPTSDAAGQAEQLSQIVHRWPETSVNYRSNLHCHVRVPGLREDLAMLKRVQAHVHHWVPRVLHSIEPLPRPKTDGKGIDPQAALGAGARWRRRRISHQRLLTPTRLAYQLEARDPTDFFHREVRDERTGRLNWAISPRLCVNLRQLLETDTVEFRHFPGTIAPEELDWAVTWCLTYMQLALENKDPMPAAAQHAGRKGRPEFRPYVHWMEVGYHYTCRKYWPAREALAHIDRWLDAPEQRAKELWKTAP